MPNANPRSIHFLEDGTVFLVREDGTKTKPISLAQMSASDVSGPLPHGTRFVYTIDKTTIYLIEQFPCMRELTWMPHPDEWQLLLKRGDVSRLGLKPEDQERTLFSLAFPYVLLFVRVENDEPVSVTVAFRNHPVTGESDYLMQAGLFPEETIDVEPITDRRHGWNAALAIDTLVRQFWSRPFSSAKNPILRVHATLPQLQTVWDWEHASCEDPLWTIETKWTPYKKTLGEFVRTLSLTTKQTGLTGDATFDRFSILLTSLSQNKRDDVHALKELASGSMRFGSQIVRVGDFLRCTQSGREVQAQEVYEVLGFYEPGTHALLDGITQPVLLGQIARGLQGFERVERKTKESLVDSVVLQDGTEICKGTLVGSRDKTLVYLRKETEPVRRLKRIGNDVLAEIGELTEWVYLATNGVLNPGFSVFVPSLKDGTFKFGNKKIAVGDVIIIGFGTMMEVVQEIREDEQKKNTFLTRFEGSAKERILFEAGQWNFEWETIVYKWSSTHTRLHNSEQTLEPNDLILVTGTKTSFDYGSVIRPLHFEKSTRINASKHDIDLVMESGVCLPVIQNNDWVFSKSMAGCQFVKEDFKLLNRSLVRGTKLRAKTNGIQGMVAGEVLTILCFIPLKGSSRLVFESGLSVPIVSEVFEILEEIDDQGNAISFSKEQWNTLPKTGFDFSGGKNPFKSGDRVRFVGKDHDAYAVRGFDNEVSHATPGTIERFERTDGILWCFVRFDRALPVIGNPPYNQFIKASALRLETLNETVVSTSMAFYRTLEKIPFLVLESKHFSVLAPPSLEAERTKLEKTGKKVRTDNVGRMISIGDFVLAVQMNYQREISSSVEEKDRVGLVIHSTRPEYDTEFIYVLHEQPLYKSLVETYEVGYRSLDPRYKTEEYMRRITVIRTEDAYRFDRIEPKPEVVQQTQPPAPL